MKLDDLVVLDYLHTCLSNRGRLEEYVKSIEELYNSAYIGGKNKLKKYVRLLSGLIYSPENVIFDIKVRDERVAKTLPTDLLKRELYTIFYNGLDVDLYQLVKSAMIYGSAFIKLIPPKKQGEDPSYVFYKPNDVLVLYPELPLQHEEQVIVLVNRIPKRAFIRQYQNLLGDNIALLTTQQEQKDKPFTNLDALIERVYDTEHKTPEQAVWQTQFVINHPELSSGELVEFYELYYYDPENERWNVALIYNDFCFYHGVSPYIGSLYPLIGFAIDDHEKSIYGESAIADLSMSLIELKKEYKRLNELVELLSHPPLMISSAMASVEEENIINNLKPKGIITFADPSTRIENYIPKVNPELVFNKIKLLEDYIDQVLMLNEGLVSGRFTNVRSYQQLALYIQTVLSDVRYFALRFEQFIERIMTLWARMLVQFDRRYGDVRVPFKVEVYAHTSSPIMAMNYQDLLLTLFEMGAIGADVLI
ncbi:MAG: hypothetical protein QW607_08100, partial [Desulfurococcaceae archaeon]